MNILITGISSGLGLNICEKILEKGWNIYGISRNKSASLNRLIDSYPQQLHWIEFDLSNYKALKNLLYKNYLKKVPFQGFINNAASAYDDIITNIRIKPLENMYNVNVLSPIIITKLILRNFLLFNTKGSIVHISSISVHTGYKGLSMYASTKGALEAFSKNCSREWGALGIRSNCIVAGFMETNMSSSLSSEQKNRIYKRTSTKKPVNIGSVSDTAVFLIEKKSISITGQNIFVDNGTI